MAHLRIPARALVVVMVMALATPAIADPSAEEKKTSAQAKKAQAAAQLDTLRANDAELEAAVRTLDAGVAAQAATTEAAHQALRAAELNLGAAQIRLAATEAKMAELRGKAAEAAIRAYVHPGGDTLLEIVRSKDLGEASRRQALLSHVVSSDRDIVDQMRATRQDEQFERENLSKARDVAADRRKAAAEKLSQLEKTRNDQVRLKDALEARIAQVTSEVAALSREEATLSALIRARQLPAEASDTPSGGGGGGGAAKVSGSGVAWPTTGSLTSGFGYRWGSLHAGVDIANGVGTPIRAAKSGTIILAGWNGGYGNCIVIDHGGGFTTLYGHMTRLRASEGQRVGQGDVIGDMGSTGNSTGSHLHFETRVNGSPQDPQRYLP